MACEIIVIPTIDSLEASPLETSMRSSRKNSPKLHVTAGDVVWKSDEALPPGLPT